MRIPCISDCVLKARRIAVVFFLYSLKKNHSVFQYLGTYLDEHNSENTVDQKNYADNLKHIILNRKNYCNLK